MNEKYSVKVNDQYDFTFTTDEVQNADIASVSQKNFHILENNKPHHAEIVFSDFNQKSYSVRIQNNVYEVTIHDALDALISEMGFEVGAKKQVNSLHAPMPGLILEIVAEIGKEVKTNDTLLILGAMKMENSFVSPRDGVIKSIAVATGDAVEKGQLLIEFE